MDWNATRGDQALTCAGTPGRRRHVARVWRYQIAKVYTVMGNVHADRRTKQDFDKCVAYYEKALEITRKYCGDGHPALVMPERFGDRPVSDRRFYRRHSFL